MKAFYVIVDRAVSLAINVRQSIQNFLSGRLFTSPSRICLRQHDAQGKEEQLEAIVTAETRRDYGVGSGKPQKPTPLSIRQFTFTSSPSRRNLHSASLAQLLWRSSRKRLSTVKLDVYGKSPTFNCWQWSVSLLANVGWWKQLLSLVQWQIFAAFVYW